jgi:hypothetical protein
MYEGFAARPSNAAKQVSYNQTLPEGFRIPLNNFLETRRSLKRRAARRTMRGSMRTTATQIKGRGYGEESEKLSRAARFKEKRNSVRDNYRGICTRYVTENKHARSKSFVLCSRQLRPILNSRMR